MHIHNTNIHRQDHIWPLYMHLMVQDDSAVQGKRGNSLSFVGKFKEVLVMSKGETSILLLYMYTVYI